MLRPMQHNQAISSDAFDESFVRDRGERAAAYRIHLRTFRQTRIIFFEPFAKVFTYLYLCLLMRTFNCTLPCGTQTR